MSLLRKIKPATYLPTYLSLGQRNEQNYNFSFTWNPVSRSLPNKQKAYPSGCHPLAACIGHLPLVVSSPMYSYLQVPYKRDQRAWAVLSSGNCHGLKARPPPPPHLIWVLGYFYLFEPRYRRSKDASSVKIALKNAKEKLVKCATEVARLYRVSMQSCTQKQQSPKVQSHSRDWI